MRTLVCQNVLNNLKAGDIILIPSNGQLNSKGHLVMGKGFALDVKNKFPAAPEIAGKLVKQNGNKVQYIGMYNLNNEFVHLMLFPTKDHWRNPSSLEIIERSCQELMTDYGGILNKTNRVYLPAPGCGAGGLNWADVEPVLDRYFTDVSIDCTGLIIVSNKNIFNRKGRLCVTSIGKLRDVDMSMYPDKRLFIVRKPTKSSEHAVEKYRLQHVPQLSPSAQLFSRYYKWKDGNFTEEEKNFLLMNGHFGKSDSWWYLYTSEFIKEMQNRSDLIKCMKRTLELLNNGVNVLMVCFCPNPMRCHRGIIGAIVQQRGYTVEFM
jgi:hypothetical protein